jgi:cold shock CspA family protein
MPKPPAGPSGTVSKGCISKLLVGQGHGFIRLTNRRQVFFHRRDLRAGTSFNELAVGDPVTFELIDDPISGARAVSVQYR